MTSAPLPTLRALVTDNLAALVRRRPLDCDAARLAFRGGAVTVATSEVYPLAEQLRLALGRPS